MDAVPCPGSLPPSRAGRGTSLGTRTRLSNVQDLAEHQGELDAASSKGTFVFVFPAAVLEDKLEKRAMTSCYMDVEGCSNSGCQTCHAPPAFLVKLSPQQVKPSLTQVSHSSQNPAPASSFPCGRELVTGTAGWSIAHALLVLSKLLQFAQGLETKL